MSAYDRTQRRGGPDPPGRLTVIASAPFMTGAKAGYVIAQTARQKSHQALRRDANDFVAK